MQLPESAKLCWRTFPTSGEAGYTRAKWHHENMCGGVYQSFHIFPMEGCCKVAKKQLCESRPRFLCPHLRSSSSSFIPGCQLNFWGWPTRQQTFLGQPQPRALDERGGIWPDTFDLTCAWRYCLQHTAYYSLVCLWKARKVSMRSVCVFLHWFQNIIKIHKAVFKTSPRHVSQQCFSPVFTSWGNEGYCGRQFQRGTDHQGAEALNVCCQRQIATVCEATIGLKNFNFSGFNDFASDPGTPYQIGETYAEQSRESRAGRLQHARAPFEECRNLTGCHTRKFSHW